jgi:hypothetical protein
MGIREENVGPLRAKECLTAGGRAWFRGQEVCLVAVNFHFRVSDRSVILTEETLKDVWTAEWPTPSPEKGYELCTVEAAEHQWCWEHIRWESIGYDHVGPAVYRRKIQPEGLRIDYELVEGSRTICETKCPFDNSVLVGSHPCYICEHNLKLNGDENYVICNNPGEIKPFYVDILPYLNEEGALCFRLPRNGWVRSLSVASVFEDFLGYVWDDHNGKEVLSGDFVLSRLPDGRLFDLGASNGTKEICKAVRFKLDKQPKAE